MADTSIDIGFTVGNDDLRDGLNQALTDFAATSAAIQRDLDGIGLDASAATVKFESFADALKVDAAPNATRRKALEDDFAAQTAFVQEEKTLNRLSADDAIAQEQRIENARFAALSAEISAQATEAGAQEKFQAQMDALQEKHNAKQRALDEKAVAESVQSWKSILAPVGNAFQSSLNGIIQGHETLRQAVAKIGQSIVTDFVDMAVKRATNWIASELTMTGATEAGSASRLATQVTADSEGKAVSAATGSASVVGDANKAAAGAYSAVSEIPIVGPVLAPAAAAAAFTAVMAYDIFSAEGGFDIPAGLNPVTQLHEREMVLPASIAEPLRSGIGGGAQAGGDIHIHAVDAASFQRLLSNNKGALAKALRGARRAFDPSLI
jgi:hypothetical protein